MNITQLYADYRPLLFTIAYRYAGPAFTEECRRVSSEHLFVILQQHPDGAGILYKAYLGKIITNRCINELKSARKARVSYIGQWLPEPLIDEAESTIVSDPGWFVKHQEEVAYLLPCPASNTTPKERAVYVLRETLYYSFDEIAELLGEATVNCRQDLSATTPSSRLPEGPIMIGTLRVIIPVRLTWLLSSAMLLSQEILKRLLSC